jgi:hypothetical protein
VGLVLLHGFLDRFEDSHCSAMVAFLLELGRILGKAARTFTGSEASWRADSARVIWWVWEAEVLMHCGSLRTCQRACSQQAVLGSSGHFCAQALELCASHMVGVGS